MSRFYSRASSTAFLTIRLLLACAGLGTALPAAAANTAPVNFEQQIRPLLAEHCYECHGPEKQKSGLRLDRKSSALGTADSGKIPILPGHADASPLVQRIKSTDPDFAMPRKGAKLSAEQVSLIRAWIDQGATWPSTGEAKVHWAYVAPVHPALPAVQNKSWPRNEIDYFVLARLEEEHLTPAPEADRAALLRRVSLDLTGLPPTLRQVKAFEQDRDPGAYEKVVDRLLASPHYGERWARPWLDLARYADTQGYEKDNRRSIWPYRDWVIRALNEDMPFDRFTIEQLAGDLLPEACQEDRVGTGFHRNTMTNTEGGTDDEEFRVAAVVDRVNTTMSVWMGTTFGCAQCHNHKYDPFTNKEYYQLFAFFNSTADHDADDESPTIQVPTKTAAEHLKELRQQIAEHDQDFQSRTPERLAAEKTWEKSASAAVESWRPLDPNRLTSTGGATLTEEPDGSVLAGGKNPKNDTYIVAAPVDLPRVTGLRLDVLPDDSLPHKSIGRHENGSFVLSRLEASVAPSDHPEAAQALVFNRAAADYTQKDHDVFSLVNGRKGPGWAIDAADPHQRQARSAYFTISNRTRFPAGAVLTVTLRHESQWPEANLGRFRLFVTDAEEPAELTDLPFHIRQLLTAAPEPPGEKRQEELWKHWQSIAPELKPLRDQLAELRREESQLNRSIPTTPVMEELAKPRETHMLVRGNFLSKGDRVEPGVPAILPPLPAGQPANRLGLARWLVDEKNPLTARVAINRMWQQYFGIGIVETSEDFGTQGEPPSHPQLLDWLATEFMRRHWDIKAMHKLIVTSATYRQSSHATPELLEKDPYNRLFSRGPRFRMEAEMIRDQALALSGLLSEKIGGPSVMPPQPDGVWQVVYSGDKWETSPGADRYRRALYTFWRRTSPYPSMVTFDAPSREFCVIKRSRSNTPLQALTLLNDPVYVEAAQGLARRIMQEGGPSPEERVTFGFRLCLARAPRPAEVQRLVRLFAQEEDHYRNHRAEAVKMAGCDKDKTEVDPAALAAWTAVANVLLNLDETVTKG